MLEVMENEWYSQCSTTVEEKIMKDDVKKGTWKNNDLNIERN